MKLKPLALAAALVAAFALPAAAQQDTLLANVPPAKLRAAERVLVAMHAEEMLKETTDEMVKTMLQQDAEMAQFEDLFREMMNEALAWDEMRPLMVRVYTDIYTEEEMGAMAAFYETPMGQRVVRKTAALTARMMELQQAQLQEKMPEMMERMMSQMMERVEEEEGEAPAPTQPARP